jgi:hypothetical protein
MMAANTDINFLLAVLHNVTITHSFADNVIEKWRKYFLNSFLLCKESNDL